MYGYIYKTTNLLNGKIYIGQKKSNEFLNEKYLGSGKILRQAIDKEGKQNFKVELLEECESAQELNEREIFWISFYRSTDPNIGYNLSDGGYVPRLSGERNGFYGKHHSQQTKDKWKSRKYKTGPDHPMYGKHQSQKNIIATKNANTGRIKTEEEKRKRLETLERNGTKYFYKDPEFRNKISKAKKGIPNKFKGGIHITNDLEDKMIFEEDLDFYLNQGWRRGRKKFSKQACENISKGHKGQRAHNKGKIWINNNLINKTIPKTDLDCYLNLGWKMGMIKRK